MSTPRSRSTFDRERIAFPEARRSLVAATGALAWETVPLAEAHARVVAQTYRAREDIVPFARSAMDGYALRAATTRAATAATPLVLPIVGESFAGEASAALAAHGVRAITTGAMLPAGADAVVPFEDVERDGDRIVVRAPLAPLEHVFEPGDDAKRGDVLVSAGHLLGPGDVALLAAAGYATVATYRRPRVALVSTGSEIVPVDATPAPGQIRNSNASMLAGALAADGALVAFAEHAIDESVALRATLERALACADLVVTTGGASTGERDYVKGLVRDLGATFVFDTVALRPAKPTAFATLGATSIAILPGNPAAAYVAYVALVRGVVRRLGGHAQPYPTAVEATLRGAIRSKPDRHFLMFARLRASGGRLEVTPLADQCSSLVRTSADANALVVVEPGTATIGDGALVRCEIVRPSVSL